MGTRARDFSKNLGGGAEGGNVSLADLLPYLTTSNVTELSNLYYSNARVFANLSLASINVLADVDTENYTANIGFGLVWTGNLWVPGAVTANLTSFTSDDLPEGTINLYYTNTRVRSAVGALNPTIIYDESTGLFAANVETFNLSANTTDAIPEGFVNLYFSNARSFANLQLASLTDLSDVDYGGNTPANLNILSYDYDANVWRPVILQSIAEADTANIVRSLANHTTDSLKEGNVNYYYSNVRFLNDLLDTSINVHFDVNTSNNLAVGKVLGWTGFAWEPIEANAAAGIGGGTGQFAEFSNIANVALYAIRAGVADNVEFANVAGYTQRADFANTAGVAQQADSANVALFAEFSNQANTAIFANYADVANSISEFFVAENATTANTVKTLSNFTTDDLLEGNTNFYYTDQKVYTNVSLMSIDVLADVLISEAQLNDVLMWNGTNWVSNSLISAPGFSNFVERANIANTVLSLDNFTTDDVQEGIVNQYYTINRVNADIATVLAGRDISVGDVITKNLRVNGNVVVVGSTVALDVATIQTSAKEIFLNTSGAPDGSGIIWSGANISLRYDQVNDALKSSRTLMVTGNIVPSISGEFNLGLPNFRWKDIWLGSTTLYLGNLRLSEGPDGQLQIFNSETGEASGATLANVNATEQVTVNRVDSSGNEIKSFIGGEISQFSEGTTGNLFLGIKKNGEENKFSGIKIQRKLYDSSNVQTDVIIYNDSEGKNPSTSRLALYGDGNIELTGEVLISGNVRIIGNTSLSLPAFDFQTNTTIISEYSNTDPAVLYSDGVITVNKDGVYEATAILTLSDDWQDTPIKAAYIPTGTYIVQITANDSAVGGGHTQEYYSGVMSWYSNDTNSGTADEIALHRAGAGPGNGTIFLRVQRTLTANSDDLKLQIAGTTINTGVSSYTFKFRRLL